MGVELLKLEHVYFVKIIGPVFYSDSIMPACASIDVLQSLFKGMGNVICMTVYGQMGFKFSVLCTCKYAGYIIIVEKKLFM